MRRSNDRTGGLRVLLVNFEMNPQSPVLGWQFKVAERLARECDHLVVLTERAANVPASFPVPVVVIPWVLQRPLRALGTKWLVNVLALYVILRYRTNAVFIHMSMEWTFRLAPSFSLLRLPTLLWYAHGSVTANLARAERAASMIVTSTPEGFRLVSTKVRVIGQGIDVKAFESTTAQSREPRMMYVGRVSRRKRIELLVEALAHLREVNPTVPFTLRIVGPMLNDDDRAYAEELRAQVRRAGLANRVDLRDAVVGEELNRLYDDVFLHVSASDTGSMDKTVLEALARGCPVVTTNEAFRELLTENGGFVPVTTPQALAVTIERAFDQPIPPETCRARVIGHHDLDSYVERVAACLRDLTSLSRHEVEAVPVEEA